MPPPVLQFDRYADIAERFVFNLKHLKHLKRMMSQGDLIVNSLRTCPFFTSVHVLFLPQYMNRCRYVFTIQVIVSQGINRSWH